jgi:dolichol-phosphate mannosyltransferase
MSAGRDFTGSQTFNSLNFVFTGDLSMKVSVVMPAYNEAEGIQTFLNELALALRSWSPNFVVVNDCSKDGTSEEVLSLARQGFPVELRNNEHNSGHGISTLRALSAGLQSGADIIIAIDGDGQFRGEDVALTLSSLEGDVVIVEGVRTHRDDPAFRRVVSLTTRLLVFFRTGSYPKDANTPLRLYRRATLEKLLGMVPSETPVPNLFISALTRKNKLNYLEIEVRSRDRLGAEVTGSTWGKGVSWLPSKRFLRFTVGAVRSWFGPW